MLVEVWSDVVCPWCYIGKRRLEAALADVAGEVTVVHRAFQLDPGAVSEGRRTVEVLARKYGITPDQAVDMMADVSEVAATLGLAYRLADTVSGNTRDAHRLILWAQEQGRGAEVLEALYAAYFLKAESVFAADDLLRIAASCGLDPEAVREMLASDAFIDTVEQDQDLARQFGANGVPFFVFDRRYGISGAQPLEVFTKTIAKALEPA